MPQNQLSLFDDSESLEDAPQVEGPVRVRVPYGEPLATPGRWLTAFVSQNAGVFTQYGASLPSFRGVPESTKGGIARYVMSALRIRREDHARSGVCIPQEAALELYSRGVDLNPGEYSDPLLVCPERAEAVFGSVDLLAEGKRLAAYESARTRGRPAKRSRW